MNTRSSSTTEAAPRWAARGRAAAFLPVLAPVVLVVGGAGGAGLAARQPNGIGGTPPQPPPGHAVGPRCSFGGTLEGRLRRLLRESERSGEARVNRAELEQMLDWAQKAREPERPAGAQP